MGTHRILVVDDDADIRESLMDYLGDHGFEAVGAVDGVDALAKLGAGEPPPCLIILDLMMPKMDGRAFREKQLADPALADIPVVVVTAHRDVSESVVGMGVANHMSKPLNLPRLLRMVQDAC